MASLLHMGQFPQDGEDGQNVAFFNFFSELYCDQTKPELELFEVWEIMVPQIIITIIPNFKQL